MKKRSSSSSLVDNLVTKFKILQECSICAAKVTKQSIGVFAKSDDLQMLHLSCPVCKNKLIFYVGISDVGIALMGIQSDLSFKDACTFYGKDVMTEDELLSAYSVLQDISFNEYLTIT